MLYERNGELWKKLNRYSRKIQRYTDSHTGLVANSLLSSRIPTEVHNNVNFSIKVSQRKLVCKGISK